MFEAVRQFQGSSDYVKVSIYLALLESCIGLILSKSVGISDSPISYAGLECSPKKSGPLQIVATSSLFAMPARRTVKVRVVDNCSRTKITRCIFFRVDGKG